jgi:hypothetical protein
MEGGVVPKNLYKADLEGTSTEHEHSLYHSISLSRGQVHNIAIHCNDPCAVLTWDFDVMRHKVLFTVLYKPKLSNSNGLGIYHIYLNLFKLHTYFYYMYTCIMILFILPSKKC